MAIHDIEAKTPCNTSVWLKYNISTKHFEYAKSGAEATLFQI